MSKTSDPAPTESRFDYPQRRLESERRWHSAKAGANKRNFYITEILTLLAGAAIPVISVWAPHGVEVPTAAAILGSIVVVSGGIARLFKFQENWLHFRAVAESLEREREFHASSVGDYAIKDAAKRNALLVERTEALLAGATTRYISAHQASGEAGTAEAGS